MIIVMAVVLMMVLVMVFSDDVGGYGDGGNSSNSFSG